MKTLSCVFMAVSFAFYHNLQVLQSTGSTVRQCVFSKSQILHYCHLCQGLSEIKFDQDDLYFHFKYFNKEEEEISCLPHVSMLYTIRMTVFV